MGDTRKDQAFWGGTSATLFFTQASYQHRPVIETRTHTCTHMHMHTHTLTHPFDKYHVKPGVCEQAFPRRCLPFPNPSSREYGIPNGQYSMCALSMPTAWQIERERGMMRSMRRDASLALSHDHGFLGSQIGRRPHRASIQCRVLSRGLHASRA